MTDVLQDIAQLVQRSAGARRELAVSPEVAGWLRSQIAAGSPRPAVEPNSPGLRAPVESAPAAKPAVAPQPQARSDVHLAVSLAALQEIVATCQGCSLCHTRKQTVFGSGNPSARLVFVGEAPGEEEDNQGLPFVGSSGQLLTDIIVKGMLLQREDVYICNVLKCRPPGNRNPEPAEMTRCEPFLVRQLQLIRPQVICALGGYAAKQLLKTDESVGRLRGSWHWYEGIPVRVTYHPSYLLRQFGNRQNEEKRKVWDDVKAVLRLLNGQETPAP